MNVRFGRILVLLALLTAIVPVSAGAADRGTETAYRPATAAEKAAEARRLADQAAVLAKRAAQLAAESRAADSAATAPRNVNVINQSTPWSTRGAAEVLISDSDPQPAAPAAAPVAETVPASGEVPTATSSIGWRSHRAAPGSAIRFSDPSVPATTASTSKPAPIPAAKEAPPAGNPDNFELKLTQAAQLYAPTIEKSTPAPLAATPSATSELPSRIAEGSDFTATNTSGAPQLLPDSIRLAATIADAKVRTADSEEPMPTPAAAPQYSDDKMMQSDGVPYGCVDDCCCPQPRPLFWTSGIEATFLRPDLNDGAAEFAVAEFGSNRFDEFSTSTNDVNDFYLAPRIWLGVQGCKWGANLRYFHLRAAEGAFDPTLGSDGFWDGPQCGVPDFGFNSCNDLEAYTVDLEVTRRVCLYDCWMQFSAGVRHAEIEHDAALSAQALADDSVLFSYADAHRASRGTGIVLGWYGRKPIFPCSCVHWFYNFRWSALWGPTETAAETGVLVSLTSTDPDAVAAAGSVNGASSASNGDMFIGEIQLGLEWDYALRCIPANAFCRVAAEYQRWDGGRGFSASNSFAGVEIDGDPTTLGSALAIADTPELDLVGLSIGAGLTW